MAHQHEIPEAVGPVMRIGYSARAIVYFILGGLTVLAAWSGGQAEGTSGALQTLRDDTWGLVLLWIVAFGLACYGIWRLTAAWFDIENRGDDEEGMFARAALVVTGIIHFALGFAVASLAAGIGGGSGDSGASDWTARVFGWPGGPWIVGLAGLAVAGAGVHYMLKGWKRKYERYIRVTSTTRKLDPLLRWGFVAYGIVLGIVGLFLLIAAYQADPSEAKGIGDALNYVRSMAFGRIMLGALGIGILGFAVENVVEAIYRIAPGTPSGKVESIRQYVERTADDATA